MERSIAERTKVEQRLIDIATVSDGWLWEMDADRRFIFVLDGDYFDDGGVPKEGLLGKTQEEWLQAHPDMLCGHRLGHHAVGAERKPAVPRFRLSRAAIHRWHRSLAPDEWRAGV